MDGMDNRTCKAEEGRDIPFCLPGLVYSSWRSNSISKHSPLGNAPRSGESISCTSARAISRTESTRVVDLNVYAGRRL